MIQDVTFEKTIYQPAPQRFEAGTGNIADAVGLGAAIGYVDRAGMNMDSLCTRRKHCSRSPACESSAPQRRRPASFRL